MDRLLYVAMTGAKQLMEQQALVSHNLANVSTTGFRADLARFEARPVEGPGHQSRVNTVATGLGFDHSQGTLVETGSVLDVAIDGAGWLAIQARDGTEALSRGGSLRVNAVGLLETERGELVLGDNGPLAVPPYTQIALEKRVDGHVQVKGGASPEPDAAVNIKSGFLEASNVGVADALVDMIEIARQFEIAVRMMQTADDNAARAANLARMS
jgi:flagellar basal-body rod protein FlgF